MLILSNIRQLYDGTGAERRAVSSSVDVHIDTAKGRIETLRPHDPSLRVGESHTLVDCSAYTVTPGLIDCHGHITVLGLDRPAMDTMLGGSMLVYVEKILHTTLVDGGVTTMRDIGG